MSMRTQSIIVGNIHVGDRLRAKVDDETVKGLVDSIGALGLRNPISVIFRNDVEIDGELYDSVPVLVAGRHRLEAIRRLGWKTVECDVFENEIAARKWEISENLHREDLTALEHDEHVAEWVRLTADAHGESKPAQIAPVSGGRGNEGGVRAAARELGIERTKVQRAVKVASLSPEAKVAAVATGLDDNRTALLAAAKETEPEKQVEIIHARVTSSPTQAADPDLDARIKAREDREKVELAKFLTTVDAVEPLLAELKCEEEVSIYDKLTYLQIAERYKPILALRPYRWRMGYGRIAGDASRRIEDARGDILRILTDKAEDEIEPAQADPFDGAPIPRTPEVDLEAA